MLTITSDSAGQGTGVLRLKGRATIEHAGLLREALLNGLDAHDHLQLDCADVTGIDFFTLQMFCSAHRTSAARNKRLTWGEKPALLAETVKANGFARQHGCPLCPDGVQCMWV